MTRPPQANIVIEFVDGQGRAWHSAGMLGPLVRHEDGVPVESLLADQTQRQEMRITSLKVITDA